MTEIAVRVGTVEDYQAMSAVFGGAMMFDPSEADELDLRMFEPERALVATADGGNVVGTTRALDRSIAGAKNGALGPSAKYSSQPDESTTFIPDRVHGRRWYRCP